MNLRIGSRGSDLALWQARHVKGLLEAAGVASEIEVITTTGDRIDDVPFSKMEGKGFFTKELEEALLDRRVDVAVHSLKDMTTESPPGLAIGALVGREDARDLLLVQPEAIDHAHRFPVRNGALLGTSSARRQALVRELAPEVMLAELRGNVPTRVRKLRDRHYDAIVIARAGVVRLGLDLSDLILVPLDIERFVPAPGQGMLAIQCRDEPELRELCARLHTAEAARAVWAERWLLEQLEGGCHLPFGCHVRPAGEGFALDLFLDASGQPGSARPSGSVAPQPALRLHLEGRSAEDLAAEAWGVVAPYRRAT